MLAKSPNAGSASGLLHGPEGTQDRHVDRFALRPRKPRRKDKQNHAERCSGFQH